MATPQHHWSPQQPRHIFLCQLWAAPLQSLRQPIIITTHLRAGQISTLLILWIMFLLWGPLLLNSGSDAGTMMVINHDHFSAFKMHFYGVLNVVVFFFRKGLMHERGHVSIRSWKWPRCSGGCQFAQYAVLPTTTNPRGGATSTPRPPTTTTSHECPSCKPTASCSPALCPPA